MDALAEVPIQHTRYLDPGGEAVRPLPAFAKDPAALVRLYRVMLRTRHFDHKAVTLQRTGQLGTYASSLGQEAIGAGLGDAMHPQDVLLPSYREYAAQLQRGARMSDLLLYWGGDERGMASPALGEDFPICVPVASQCCHAVGVAQAFRYRRQARVAVCVLGDGATSKGDFYESLNLAGVWRLPVLFVINNNQWAISVPRSRQSAARTLAEKGIAAGVPGEQVDGNDVVAVREVLAQALARARDGQGARVIEALSYRLGDHTTADDASRYRDATELAEARARDPIDRLRAYLIRHAGWTEAQDRELRAACAAEADDAARAYLALPPQPATSMLEHLFAHLPRPLEGQREALERDPGP